MNVTLILYESRYGTGKNVANIICPVLGPAKSFDINDVPQDIKHYSNVVLVFSLYRYESCEKILLDMENNKIDISKKKVALLCIGLSKKDGTKELNKIKSIINKEDALCEFIEGEMYMNKLTQNDKSKIKDIVGITDEEPVLNSEMLMLGRYMSENLLCSLVSAYQVMLPKALKAEINSNIKIKYNKYLRRTKTIEEIDEYIKKCKSN